MHTFVINTSTAGAKKRDDKFEKLLDGILEIPKIKKDLSILDCPVDTWDSKDKGCEACVTRMCEMIDSYREITGDFNLIIYADLYAYEKKLIAPETEEKDREICVGALRLLFRRYFISTLLERLESDFGLAPAQVVLIIDENTYPSNWIADKDTRELAIAKKVTEYIGISPDVWDRVGDAKISIGEGILPGAADCYSAKLKTWMESDEKSGYRSPEDHKTMDDEFLTGIKELGKKDKETGLPTVCRNLNRVACGNNTSMARKMTMELYLYILDCVYSGSLCTAKGKAKALGDIVDWDALKIALAHKQKEYDQSYRDTVNLTKSFADLGMAPRLRKLDVEKFGLTGSGGPKIEREEERDTGKKGSDGDRSKGGEEQKGKEDKEKDGGISGKTSTRLVEKERKFPNLFDKSAYVPFADFYKIEDLSLFKMGTDPKKYKEKAKEVRDFHEEYLTDRLKKHVQSILARYSAPSEDNDPAILAKRKVSITSADFEKEADECRYATAGTEETRKSADLSDLASRAYATVEKQFFAFNAGRPVAVTNIDEECDNFLTRVDDITESLRRLKTIALGSVAALLVLYVPFLVIQWNAITENTGTKLIALASVGIPLVILGAIILVLGLLQKRKYIEAWKDFKKTSDELLAANDETVRQFDELLSNVIPSLRWVYNYKLDVEFYVDCCRIAASKLEHHKKMLLQRAEDTMNILQNLDYVPAPSDDPGADRRKPDYTVAYCDSEQNKDFYSIVDRKVLGAALKREEDR